jgi:hypothetical protein
MYRQVLGIQNHLSPTNGFKYDETVEPTDNQYALVDFLTKTKRGFCQQFASAMAVLLRSIGIPARVAVGFTQGTFDSQTDVTTVTSADAHSWVEVWFGNAYGWLAFEPTPRRANPTAFEYYDPARVQCALSGRTCSGAGAVQTTGSPAGGHPSRGANSPTAFLARKEGKIQPGLRPLPPPSPGPPYGALVLAAFGVLLLALLFVPPIRSLRRRLRVRRAVRQPRRLILVTYDVFTERAADIGLGRRAGETVEEYRRRIHAETAVPAGARGSDGAALTDGELDRLSTLVARAAYALDEPAASDAEQAVRCARAVIRDLRRSVGPARRLAGAWRSNR